MHERKTMSILVETKNLTKSYDSHHTAVSNLNLTIESGRIIGLLGPNGSGKTTLIKMMNGLLIPSSGSLLIDGHAPGVETKSVVSYLPERTYLENSFTVNEQIKVFTEFYKDFNKEKALEMLEKLSINPSARMKSLSKGTKEKVQLILVMSREAKLYLLDEPIAGVDPAARDYILNTILSNYSNDSTIIMSTHLISDVENILDEAIMIKNGNLLLHDTADNIRSNTGKSIDGYFREVFAC